MGGNKHSGYISGHIVSHRHKHAKPKWFCEGCQREHGNKITRWGKDGKLYCSRAYERMKKKEGM